MKRFYINGDPARREKFRSTVRVVWFCFVYTFALIGIGNTAYFVWHYWPWR